MATTIKVINPILIQGQNRRGREVVSSGMGITTTTKGGITIAVITIKGGVTIDNAFTFYHTIYFTCFWVLTIYDIF